MNLRETSRRPVRSDRSLPEQADTLPAALAEAQRAYHLFPDADAQTTPTPVVVGVSGGADSVALLHALLGRREEWHLALHVAHLDHNLRPNSQEDAHFVAHLAAQWGLPCTIQRVDEGVLQGRGNLEAAARQARYRFLATVAGRLHKEAPPCPLVRVAVAHTANDQAETVLMNLMRGSGLDGLAGMRPQGPLVVAGVPQPGVLLVRPLLNVQRAQIVRYLNAHGIAWREDPTNQDRTRLRNRIRHEILPQLAQINPQIVATLGRTAALLAAEADRADVQNWQALKRPLVMSNRHRGGRGRLVLDLAEYRRLDTATQRGALRCAGLTLGLSPEALTFDVIERLRRSLLDSRPASRPHPWVGDVMVSISPPKASLHYRRVAPFEPDHPFLSHEWLALYGARPLALPGRLELAGWTLSSSTFPVAELPPHWRDTITPWQAFLDAGKIGELLLTGPRQGQRFAPLGLQGHTKSLGDFFTDRKVPVGLRQGWPIVIDSDSAEVVWVCGLAVAHPARITERTRQVLYLRWERSNA